MKDGITLLLGISLAALSAIFAGQFSLSYIRGDLDAQYSNEKLWERYRRSVDPFIRREAAFLLVSKSKDSALRRKRLLQAQGWGNSSLAAVAIKLKAKASQELGEDLKAKDLWLDLINRFPASQVTADSYYFLGRDEPNYRSELLKLYPAHPAALAAAIELEPISREKHKGALHLAKWGPRWHGAEKLIRSACNDNSASGPNKKERQLLARALARLGDGGSALDCLSISPQTPELILEIAQALLNASGGYENQSKGIALIQELINKYPESEETLAGLHLLSSLTSNDLAKEIIYDLSPYFIHSSPSISAARVIMSIDNQHEKVIRRWQDKPVIWELQWYLARESLLKNEWAKARKILEIIPSNVLPKPISSRILFWKAFTYAKLNDTEEARKIWKKLIESFPPDYYTWRADERLGSEGFPDLGSYNPLTSCSSATYWHSIPTKYNLVKKLWRLGVVTEAWETWRSLSLGKDSENQDDDELLSEAILRMAVGDDWTGLAKLRELNLRTSGKGDKFFTLLETTDRPYRYLTEINSASMRIGIRPELLLGVAKQESRFSPTVVSSQGAVGLMQIMPSTASELIEDFKTNISLDDPELNLFLGAKYLSQLLEIWNGNPFLALASYNAGPMSVSIWLSDEITKEPELWVERIPFPETRFYTKKVLGNFWSYYQDQKGSCIERD